MTNVLDVDNVWLVVHIMQEASTGINHRYLKKIITHSFPYGPLASLKNVHFVSIELEKDYYPNVSRSARLEHGTSEI